MLLSIKPVPLSVIKFSNTWNLHPWHLDSYDTALKRSLTKLGVLHPPLVIQNSSSFMVLAGHKRLLFLQSTHQNHDAIKCLVVPQETPVELLLEIILTDQQTSSPLSLPEKAQFVSIASKYLSKSEIIKRYFDQLQLKKRDTTFQLLEDLLEQDNDIIREAHRDKINENMIVNLLQLNPISDRVKLVNFFKKLNLGVGKQKKFYSLFRDVSRLNQTTIGDYLEREEIVSILEHKDKNIPQIIHNLGNILEKNLTPKYTQAEKEFAQKVKEMKVPAHYKITHSPSFEKDEVTLSVTFNSFEKCRQYLLKDLNLHKKKVE